MDVCGHPSTKKGLNVLYHCSILLQDFFCCVVSIIIAGYFTLQIQKQKYENFGVFEKSDFYWKPSTQASVLYEQLSKKKYREIPRNQLQ